MLYAVLHYLSQGNRHMKTAEEWSTYIIAFMQKNPVTTFLAAKQQIQDMVQLVQNDVIENPPKPKLDA